MEQPSPSAFSLKVFRCACVWYIVPSSPQLLASIRHMFKGHKLRGTTLHSTPHAWHRTPAREGVGGTFGRLTLFNINTAMHQKLCNFRKVWEGGMTQKGGVQNALSKTHSQSKNLLHLRFSAYTGGDFAWGLFRRGKSRGGDFATFENPQSPTAS